MNGISATDCIIAIVAFDSRYSLQARTFDMDPTIASGDNTMIKGEAILLRCIVLIACLFVGATLSLPALAEAPANDALSARILQLDDPDPVVREQATRELWIAGAAAEPLLRQASQDQSPEIARRASAILHNITYGLLPDTPPEVIELLGQYQQGDETQRAIAVARLSNLGPRGIRVLLAIRKNETDATRQQAILDALVPHAREGAQALIADGDIPRAQALLTAAAPITEAAARDYAAFLLVRGELAPKFAELKGSLTPTSDRGSLRELMFLARAAGDLKTARWAAEQTEDSILIDQMLIELEDWKALADRYQSRIGDSASIEAIGYAMAFDRLAGDADGVIRAAIAIKAHAAQHPEDYPKCAEILCLQDRAEDGIDILIRHKDYLRAFDYLLPRMEYQRALELVKTAQDEHFQQLPRLMARSTLALRFAGRLDEAHKRLDDLESGRRPDIATWCEIIDARREIDGAAKADEVLIRALTLARGEAAAELLAHAGIAESFPASFWLETLRRQQPNADTADLFKVLKAMAVGQLPPAQLREVAEAARSEAGRLVVPSVARDDALSNIGQTLFAAGQTDLAEECFRALAQGSSNPDPMTRVGDCQAARKEWAAAAASYHLAWERDRSRSVPLASEAAALSQLGQTQRARALLDLAHLLPLSNDVARVDLADTLSRDRIVDEAHREQETILATAPFLSWGLCHVVRLRGDDALTKNDPAASVRLWEHAFLQNLKYNVGFGDAWANSAVAALIHRTQAASLIKASDWAGALQEAKRCRATSPGDADAMIQLVNDFDEHGRKQEADELFNTTVAGYAKLASLYPESGPLENLQAWLAGKCRRNLDEALRQALHATAMEPGNTASLDTLAEVYFQRGQIAEAIKAMNRCIELEPTVEHHKKQIERFKAAMKTGS